MVVGDLRLGSLVVDCLRWVGCFGLLMVVLDCCLFIVVCEWFCGVDYWFDVCD